MVNHVEFPEYSFIKLTAIEQGFMNSFSWESSSQQTPGEIYGRYSVRTIYCTINELPVVNEIDGAVVKTARVFFNDGTQQENLLGNIYCHL
ncbi:MAG: hypothetical protein ACQEP4_03935 [Bacillota bacterium]